MVKAEKTKHLIDSMVGKILNEDNHLKNTSILNAHLAASDKELLELERLAEIGKATEFAYKKGFLIHDDFYQLPDAESLLNWYIAKE